MAKFLKRQKTGLFCFVFLTIFYGFGIFLIKNSEAKNSVSALRDPAEQVVKVVLLNEKKDSAWQSALSALDASSRSLDIAIAAHVKNKENRFSELTEIELRSLKRFQDLLQGSGKGLPPLELDELMQELLDEEALPLLDVISFVALERSGALEREYLENHSQYYNGVKKLAVRLHQQGFLDLAITTLDALISLETKDFSDPELMAWKGSAICKQALFINSSLEKMELVNKGSTLIDAAAYDHPDFFVVRYIRANTYQNLPDIFKKEGLLVEDLLFLISTYVEKREVRSVKGYKNIVSQHGIDASPLKDVLKNTEQVIKKSPGLSDKVRALDSTFF